MSNRDAQTIIGMSREIKELKARVEERDRLAAELQSRLDDLTESILNLAPECWDGDESAEWLAVEFVKSLIGDRPSDYAGHRCDGVCFR